MVIHRKVGLPEFHVGTCFYSGGQDTESLPLGATCHDEHLRTRLLSSTQHVLRIIPRNHLNRLPFWDFPEARCVTCSETVSVVSIAPSSGDVDGK